MAVKGTSYCHLALMDANISERPKLYLFDFLNRTMCGGDMNPYSISGGKPQPPNVFLDIIGLT